MFECDSRYVWSAVERRPGEILEGPTIRQMKAQYRLNWRRHADGFAQPRDTTASQVAILQYNAP